MKRILFGIGCSMALAAVPAAAQDRPAASLGRPAASLGRPVADVPSYLSDDVRPAAAIDFVPKTMPKGTVNEAPMLPVPGPMIPMVGGPAITAMPPTPYLGMPGVVPGGPVMMPSPGMGNPMMAGPMMTGNGPIIGSPMGDCGPGGCGVGGWDSGGMPVPMNRWYTSAEYLLWRLKGYEAPPLATVGPVASQGIIGQPGVAAIFPTDKINNNLMSGARFSLGYWFCPKWALETNFFFVYDAGNSFSASSGQFPNSILARPFFSVNQGKEFVEQIGNPGIYSGGINVTYKSELYGLDLNLRRHLYQTCTTRVDLLIGARTLYLKDTLTVAESAMGLAGAPRQFVGQQRALTDQFATKNSFYGGQIGVAFEQTWGRWSLGAQAKFAVGTTVVRSDISGGVAGGSTSGLPGGLLALNSNIGAASDHRLSYVPELNLNVGYDLTPHTRVFVGYSFLYWSHVGRPGNQIDRSLDEYRIPDFTAGRNPLPPATSAVRPLNLDKSENFWAQGINVGLQFRW